MMASLEVTMTYPFPSHSTHTLTQPCFPVIEFEPLLDSVEAAALLRIHPKTLQKKARRGVIPGHHIGKCWRFRVSDLNEWLCSHESGAQILATREQLRSKRNLPLSPRN
jgi:excisionase family DNA binding protein